MKVFKMMLLLEALIPDPNPIISVGAKIQFFKTFG